jgi:hypothetical protein
VIGSSDLAERNGKHLHKMTSRAVVWASDRYPSMAGATQRTPFTRRMAIAPKMAQTPAVA